MPELPEVEVTVRGIRPLLQGKRIRAVVVRRRKLRWPVPRRLDQFLPGQRIRQIVRRGKYILILAETGTLIIHLGMSGSMRVTRPSAAVDPYDRFDLVTTGGRVLRLRDPRCFGSVLWTDTAPEEHPLLARLGPEPLGPDFDGHFLAGIAQRRRAPIKCLIMDSHVVVGIGNIYASESLYQARIHPRRAGGRIALPRYHRLAGSIRQVLTQAIAAGGTTLRDFANTDGRTGYFRVMLGVYGRAGAPCRRCGTPIRKISLGQRSTYYCPHCQH